MDFDRCCTCSHCTTRALDCGEFGCKLHISVHTNSPVKISDMPESLCRYVLESAPVSQYRELLQYIEVNRKEHWLSDYRSIVKRLRRNNITLEEAATMTTEQLRVLLYKPMSRNWWYVLKLIDDVKAIILSGDLKTVPRRNQ